MGTLHENQHYQIFPKFNLWENHYVDSASTYSFINLFAKRKSKCILSVQSMTGYEVLGHDNIYFII